MSALQNKPVALWFELGGINLWCAESSQCRTTKLSQRQYKGQLIWSGLQVLYLLRMNLTTSLGKQRWWCCVLWHSLFWLFRCSCLHSIATDDVPGLAILSVGRRPVWHSRSQCGWQLVPLLWVSEPHDSKATSSWGGQNPLPAFIPSQAGAHLPGIKTIHLSLELCTGGSCSALLLS